MGLRRLLAPLRGYGGFSGPARLYLAGMAGLGLVGTVWGLLLNYYYRAAGLGEGAIGLANALPAAVIVVLGYPLGALTARLDSARALFLGAVAGTLAALAVALASGPLLLAAAAGQGIPLALWAAHGPAFMADNSLHGQRAHLFSAELLMNMAGGLVGNLLGARLPTWAGNALGAAPGSLAALRGALLLTVALQVGGVLLIAYGLRGQPWRRAPAATAPGGAAGPRGKTGADGGPPAAPPGPAWRTPYRRFGALLLPPVLWSLAAALWLPFVNLFFDDRFGLGPDRTGVVLAAAAVPGALGVALQPWLAGRFGRLEVVAGVQVAGFAATAAFGLAPWPGLAAAALACRYFFLTPSQVYLSYAVEQVREDERPHLGSAWGAAWWGAQMAGTAASGWWRQQAGAGGWGWLLAAAVLLQSGSVLALWRLRRRRAGAGAPAG